MGSSWVLVCVTALLLTLLSSAAKDDHNMEQREVTFDIDTKMQQPDSMMMQKEADLTDLFDFKDFPIEQVMVSPSEQFDTVGERGVSRPGVLTPRGSRPNFWPRAHVTLVDYPVQFPHGRPTPDNLQAVCLHGDHRPLYPRSYFPGSGFGQERRKASAVNNAESWFSTCCKGNQTWGEEVTLCCTIQAWKLSVESFCEEDSSVKDRLYHCCRLKGNERLNCFHDDAPNPNYEPTEELPVTPLPSEANFIFDPDTCQRTAVTQINVRANRGKKEKQRLTSQKIDINFPPGRPTAASVESICRNQKFRPLYSTKCLPSTGHEIVSHQAKTINRLEKRFKQCCKKKQDVLTCADEKWREELNKFCSTNNGKVVDFQCCSASGAIDRFNCFETMSPDPHYNMTTEELSLTKICDSHKIIKKMFPVGFPLKSFVDKCCPLSQEEKNTCFGQKLEETSDSLCITKKASPPAVRRCCRKPPQEVPQCITKILMDAITKATKVLRQQKKKKTCPIS